MIAGLALVLAALQVGGDTVSYDVTAAIRRGVEVSAALSTSRSLAEAAADRARQAEAWTNPSIGVSVENLGQQRAFTGIDGVAGLEGQVVLSTALPWSTERRGAVRTARASAEGFSAAAEAREIDVRLSVMREIAVFLRDWALVETAEEELSTLSQLSTALNLQAEGGRASEGDAARANLARVMAATALARREATLAVSATEMARLLGHGAGTPVRVEIASCDVGGSPGPSTPSGDAPELRLVRARTDQARGSVLSARGIQIPDLAPQFGLRRSGGMTGFYLGVTATLPIFDLGSRRVSAARAEVDAALAEERGAEAGWQARHAAAARAVAAFERAGASFDSRWFSTLEQTVTATEARFDLGEGTLFELLDSRRARLQALDDYHVWRAEWWMARADIARLEGRPLAASLLCDDPVLGGL